MVPRVAATGSGRDDSEHDCNGLAGGEGKWQGRLRDTHRMDCTVMAWEHPSKMTWHRRDGVVRSTSCITIASARSERDMTPPVREKP